MEAYKILKECSDILKKKGEDYNNGTIKPDDYFLYGRKSYMQMIHLKTTRLRNASPRFTDAMASLISSKAKR